MLIKRIHALEVCSYLVVRVSTKCYGVFTLLLIVLYIIITVTYIYIYMVSLDKNICQRILREK